VHHGKQILEPWLKANKDKIELFFLPSYSPELNPDEYFNGTLKRILEQYGNSDDLNSFTKNVRASAFKIQKNKQLIMNLYHAKNVRYAM